YSPSRWVGAPADPTGGRWLVKWLTDPRWQIVREGYGTLRQVFAYRFSDCSSARRPAEAHRAARDCVLHLRASLLALAWGEAQKAFIHANQAEIAQRDVFIAVLFRFSSSSDEFRAAHPEFAGITPDELMKRALSRARSESARRAALHPRNGKI